MAFKSRHKPNELMYAIPMDRSTAYVTFERAQKLAEMARKRGDEERATQIEEIITTPNSGR